MTSDAKAMAFVLAGGEGTRLYPLTANHAKPALPFARGRRIVDFVLSNLLLSQIAPIYVLAQYKPRSLIDHIDDAWADWSRGDSATISVRLPAGGGDRDSFKGTADAVRQNVDLVQRHRPDIVAIFAADHVYRMDVRQMMRFHRERGADVTIAVVPIPIVEASSFGVARTGASGELIEFHEKPQCAVPMPGDPARALASMGNYLFKSRVLVELIEEASRRGATDFGRDILPRLPGSCRVFAYDFSTNRIPGIKPYEERGYWRDVGTRQAYEAALRDVYAWPPRFDLDNPEWPITRRRDKRQVPMRERELVGLDALALRRDQAAARHRD